MHKTASGHVLNSLAGRHVLNSLAGRPAESFKLPRDSAELLFAKNCGQSTHRQAAERCTFDYRLQQTQGRYRRCTNTTVPR